jgi:hypothetical protein
MACHCHCVQCHCDVITQNGDLGVSDGLWPPGYGGRSAGLHGRDGGRRRDRPPLPDGTYGHGVRVTVGTWLGIGRPQRQVRLGWCGADEARTGGHVGQVTDGNVDLAVDMFLESGGAGAGAGGAAVADRCVAADHARRRACVTRCDGGRWGHRGVWLDEDDVSAGRGRLAADGVRAPIPQTQGRLIDGGEDHVRQLLTAATRTCTQGHKHSDGRFDSQYTHPAGP